ncbi:MAG: hypothetical protein PHT99_08050 [Methanoregula sp.]|nr:hypothetical protein [Methanoregula sp.]
MAAARYSPASKKDPVESIREFIGDPAAPVRFERTMTNVMGENIDMYTVNMDRFAVDAETGTLISASFISLSPVTAGNYSLDTAGAVGLAYAKKNYPDFSVRNMQLTESKTLDHGAGGVEYSFTWSEQSYGINIGNYVHVSVDPLGRILNYFARDIPAPGVEPAKIGKETANTTAVDYVITSTRISNITSIESTSQLTVLPTDQKRVVWNVNLAIHFRSPDYGGMEDHRGGIVWVDAMNGSVVGYEPCM